MAKFYTTTVGKEFNDEEKSLVAWASKSVVDRDGELILPGAWDLGAFTSNPVILLSHDYKQLPVGKALWTKQESDGLKFKVRFASTPNGDEAYQLFKEGILNAFSVGFIPKEEDTGEIARKHNAKRVYKKVELLEISVVSVPSCPAALVERANSGLITKDFQDAVSKIVAKKAIDEKGGDEHPEIVPEVTPEVEDEIEPEVKIVEEAKTKTADEAGNPSAKDIKEAIEAKMNKPIDGPYAMAQFRYCVEDLYPISYPDGHFIVEVYNMVSGSTGEYWRYDYRYNNGDPEIMGGLKMEEVYKPKQDLANMERALSSITIATKAGAVLSASNRDRVVRFRDAASQAVSTADELLSIANPDKEKKSLDNEGVSRVKMISLADELKKAIGNGLIKEAVKEELARITGRM